MKGISNRFPGVIALDNVDFCCQAGEVHALVGENGAGKTTLMVFWGARDAGTILMTATQSCLRTRRRDYEGIGFIHQELNLLPNDSVRKCFSLTRDIRRGAIE